MNDLTPEDIFKLHEEAEEVDHVRLQRKYDDLWKNDMQLAIDLALVSLEACGWRTDLKITTAVCRVSRSRLFGMVPSHKRVISEEENLAWAIGIYAGQDVYFLRDGSFKVGKYREKHNLDDLLRVLAPSRHAPPETSRAGWEREQLATLLKSVQGLS